MDVEQRVRVPVRARSLNTERRGHWSARASDVDAWSATARLAASGLLTGPPRALAPMNHAHVTFRSALRSTLPDTGNDYATAKAILDGLVDAGVLWDDDGEHVTAITMFAPVRIDDGDPFVDVTLHGPLSDRFATIGDVRRARGPRRGRR